MLKKIRQKEKAFTLTEVLIVVGLAVVLASGVYILYNQVKSDIIVKEETTFIRDLKNMIVNINDAVDHFDQATATNLINGGAIPSQNVSSGAIISTKGNAVTVTAVQLTTINRLPLPATGTANAFYISIASINSKECVAMVNENQLYFDGIMVINPTHSGGTWVKQKPDAAYSIANATGACLSTSGADTVNTIRFYTYKSVA